MYLIIRRYPKQKHNQRISCSKMLIIIREHRKSASTKMKLHHIIKEHHSIKEPRKFSSLTRT